MPEPRPWWKSGLRDIGVVGAIIAIVALGLQLDATAQSAGADAEHTRQQFIQTKERLDEHTRQINDLQRMPATLSRIEQKVDDMILWWGVPVGVKRK